MKYTFPSTFKFGVADSDLQVIGEKYTQKFEDSQPTMWEYFSQHSKKCYKNQSPAEGIDRYHKWNEDIEIIKQLNIKHYRTSISLARIIKADGTINKKAITWYVKYFKALKNAGVHIYATLYHWELPQAYQDKGGWKNRDTIYQFIFYTKAVITYLGEYISEYFILNEPRCSSFVGYYYGVHAPGETNLQDALLAAHNLLLGQGLALLEIQRINPKAKICTALNVGPRYALSTNHHDILAANIVDGMKNRWFLDPIFLGKYPEFMVELFAKKMPHISNEDMKIIRIGSKMHALGLNYYRGDLVKFNQKKDFEFDTLINENGLKSDLGWGIYLPPFYEQGLYDILQQVYYSYNFMGLNRIYITENGTAAYTPWDKKQIVIDDTKRIYFLQEHLKLVNKAILRGIPVDAYFAWTLMDNYEWAEGYNPHSAFGLIHVDRKNMKRIWKKSAFWYKKLVSNYSITE